MCMVSSAVKGCAMLTITDAVKDKLRARLESRPEKNLAVRLAITGRGREAFRYDFRTVFNTENPNPVWTDPKGPAILEVIDNKINPAIAAHGGRVTLLDVQDDVAYI